MQKARIAIVASVALARELILDATFICMHKGRVCFATVGCKCFRVMSLYRDHGVACCFVALFKMRNNPCYNKNSNFVLKKVQHLFFICTLISSDFIIVINMLSQREKKIFCENYTMYH